MNFLHCLQGVCMCVWWHKHIIWNVLTHTSHSWLTCNIMLSNLPVTQLQSNVLFSDRSYFTCRYYSFRLSDWKEHWNLFHENGNLSTDLNNEAIEAFICHSVRWPLNLQCKFVHFTPCVSFGGWDENNGLGLVLWRLGLDLLVSCVWFLYPWNSLIQRTEEINSVHLHDFYEYKRILS